MKQFKLKITCLFAFLLSIGYQSIAQDYTQTIRGKIIDQDSRIPAIGANVVVVGSDPIQGASTDLNGEFRIENVKVGRVTLLVTYLGYEDKVLSNLLVGSGKELVLNVEIAESVVKMNEVQVTATKNKAEVLNEMATVSARTFSVEETKRYAGAINDPARMVSAYAGVVPQGEGNNDIIVRGNSPKGILWRMEGVEIPNPNHFADEGSTGGPINALNSAMLSNSDFFTGAFPAEYGNASSGVFDIKLRNGNNERREYAFSAGVLGIDFTAEGPFKANYNGSYLVNYRYSSLAILDNLNLVDFGGIPLYQDASFKVLLPAGKAGYFSLFGLGGISSISQEETSPDDEEKVLATSSFGADMGVIGLTHTYLISDKTYFKTILSVSGTKSEWEYETPDENDIYYYKASDAFEKSFLRGSFLINHKFNARHTLKSGVILTKMGYNLYADGWNQETNKMEQDISFKGASNLTQAYTSWKYRIGENWTLNSGLHVMYLTLNNNYSIEPRAGLKWQFKPNQSFTAGFGVHSKMENISNYLAETYLPSGQLYRPNMGIDLAKARHYVLGYDYMITPNLYFKTEVYFQDLYDIPVERDTLSSYSMINAEDYFTTTPLNNSGTGQNYGIEFTLERYFDKKYFFLFTTSLYESKYTGSDGKSYDSKYNGNYAGNLLFGREFIIGDPAKSRTLGVNLKVALLGGKRYTPIDLEASREAGYTIRQMDKVWSAKGENIFQTDISVNYRKNRKKSTQEIKLEILNVTNNDAITNEWYSPVTDQLEHSRQLSLIPNLMYRIEF